MRLNRGEIVILAAPLDERAIGETDDAFAVDHLVAARREAGAGVGGEGGLQREAGAAVAEARRLARLLDVHAEVDQVGEHLGMSLRLHVATHHAE